MNPFVSRIRNNQAWVIPVSVLSLVLGFMIAMARVTGDAGRTRLPWTDQIQKDRITQGTVEAQERIRQLTAEVSKLREESTTYQKLVAEQEDGSKALNRNLQEAKLVACMTPVQGPGVTVTLSDYKPQQSSEANTPRMDFPVDEQIIHDQDVLRVVNEMYASGAEALSINNIRLGPTSSIRCVGPTVLIDTQPVASPIRIRAIGDPETLTGGLTMPGGILEELKSVDPRMVSLEKSDMISMPGYAGTTSFKYATVTKTNP